MLIGLMLIKKPVFITGLMKKIRFVHPIPKLCLFKYKLVMRGECLFWLFLETQIKQKQIMITKMLLFVLKYSGLLSISIILFSLYGNSKVFSFLYLELSLCQSFFLDPLPSRDKESQSTVLMSRNGNLFFGQNTQVFSHTYILYIFLPEHFGGCVGQGVVNRNSINK